VSNAIVLPFLLMKTEVLTPSLCNPLGSGLTGQSGIGLGTTTKPFLSQLDERVGLGSEGVGLTEKGCFLPTRIADFNKIGQMVESGPTMQMTGIENMAFYFSICD